MPLPQQPKHKQIFETLLDEIQSGLYSAGDQMPTEVQLMSRFDVSRPTVTRAVQELVRLEFVVRRVGAGTFIRPRPSTGRKMFGLLVPELGDSEIFEPICGHIARVIQRAGHGLQWGDGSRQGPHRLQASAATEACRGFIESGVSGVFFAPFVMPAHDEDPNPVVIRSLQSAGVEVVLIDRDIVPFPERSEHDLVTVDHLRGQARVTNYLLGLGHRRLSFWTWEDSTDTMQLRGAGIQRAMAQSGIDFDPHCVQSCNPDDQEEVQRLLATHQSTAIMCENDVFAAHLLRTLDALQICVPDDISVVGYDDVNYCSFLRVSLTTVSQPCEQLGRTAAQVMLDRVAHPELSPREVLLTPKLVIRDSTSAPASAPTAAIE